jgi:dCTP diphosphatase
MHDIDTLNLKLGQFISERDWDQFHSPKNLVMGLVSEVGELTEHFQWLTEEESRALNSETREKISEELADVFLYLLMISRKLDIDILKAATEKIKINEKKYPVEKSKGSSRKYNEL